MNNILDTLKDYTEKRIEILKMEAAEFTAKQMGSLVFIIMLFIFIFCFFVFLNVGLGLWVGSYFDNYAYGILLIAFSYFSAFALMIIFRKSIKRLVFGKFLSLFFNNDQP
jgi:uncharacterized membrane protein